MVGSEKCDDFNADSYDGCSDESSIETGYACTGTPSVCTYSMDSWVEILAKVLAYVLIGAMIILVILSVIIKAKIVSAVWNAIFMIQICRVSTILLINLPLNLEYFIAERLLPFSGIPKWVDERTDVLVTYFNLDDDMEITTTSYAGYGFTNMYVLHRSWSYLMIFCVYFILVMTGLAIFSVIIHLTNCTRPWMTNHVKTLSSFIAINLPLRFLQLMCLDIWLMVGSNIYDSISNNWSAKELPSWNWLKWLSFSYGIFFVILIPCLAMCCCGITFTRKLKLQRWPRFNSELAAGYMKHQPYSAII